ncbi:unnamed protein product [Rhizoctonia solani]|uniref:Uncharacterized protein n=1 Tax=Rhizoctonia solani TaxID=456999 RepID=A0A8H3HAM4_9AGAM|nr:unnamed protein product [Rhizoctonia solani]
MGPVVITDVAAVKELVDKHSQSTVDCPPNHVADLVAGGMNVVLAARYIQDSSCRVTGSAQGQAAFGDSPDLVPRPLGTATATWPKSAGSSPRPGLNTWRI